MIEREKCCGCGACYNICPQNCISFEEDKLGFLYPIVDNSKCVNCRMCEAVCPGFHDAPEESPSDIYVYGGYCNNINIRGSSSSGGFFYLIAEKVLNKGGVIYGAAINKNNIEVEHIKVTNIKELHLLQGSKYVQSKTFHIFQDVKNELISGKKVLFSGTPCQIEGLNLFLDSAYENLITIEVICHGVPAPALLKRYISDIERKMNDTIKEIQFRDEIFGDCFYMKITTTGGAVYRKDKYTDPFYRLFLSNVCLRDSCYQCPSRGLVKRANVTLADLWGVEQVAPTLIDHKGGISLLIAHDEKGKQVLESIKQDTIGLKIDYDNAIKSNQAFLASYVRSEKRDLFERDFEQKSLSRLVREYTFNLKEILIIILFKLHLLKPLKKILRRGFKA